MALSKKMMDYVCNTAQEAMPTLKSKGIVSVFRARINRFDEDFGFLSEGIFLAY